MPGSDGDPRVRQAVLAAHDLDAAVAELRAGFGAALGEPFSDPAVGAFGLRNAVFALGDTFLEVVSPLTPGPSTSAGRLLQRRSGDCGYMVMVQVPDLAGARRRASAAAVREVFEVELPDMAEVHLHPADMRGAIVSLSAPVPVGSWRWGGPEWVQRGADVGLSVAGVTVAVADVAATEPRWAAVLGGLPGITFAADPDDPGLVEIRLAGDRPLARFEVGGVRFSSVS
jgi:hypothetical protein